MVLIYCNGLQVCKKIESKVKPLLDLLLGKFLAWDPVLVPLIGVPSHFCLESMGPLGM